MRVGRAAAIGLMDEEGKAGIEGSGRAREVGRRWDSAIGGTKAARVPDVREVDVKRKLLVTVKSRLFALD